MGILHRISTSFHYRWSQHKLREHGLDQLLSHPPQVAKPINPIEAWWLYSDIVNRKPGNIVELGCGYFTIVILAAMTAYKLPDGSDASYLGYDANKDWTQSWIQLAEGEELSANPLRFGRRHRPPTIPDS